MAISKNDMHNIIIIGGLVIVVGFGAYLYKNYSAKQAKNGKEKITEQKRLNSQQPSKPNVQGNFK